MELIGCLLADPTPSSRPPSPPLLPSARWASPPPDAAPPRVSLLNLPTEIKAHILQLARQQDEAYEERVRLERGKTLAISQRLDGGWYGMSANALFVANKEFNRLSRVVFEVSVQ